jgi:predicted  nucleic acid-binding Zn-ribbon protein
VLDPARVTPMQAIRYTNVRTPASYRTPHQQQRAPPHPSQQLVLSHERKSNDTAAAFARTAPQAGYLYKLGSHNPDFKRRFFVLKPSTHLYYFVSPHDTEPRGCIDLDGSQIQPLETLPDGAVRFAIQLLDQEKSVVLEARTNGPAWMESLQTERLSFCQQELLESKQLTVGYKQRISDLEKQVRDFQMVEKDRDGALEDAANWKNQYEQLNEAVRVLTMKLRMTDDDPDNNTAAHDIAAFENASTETHFSALHNACQQLKESVRLVAIEASTAVEDLQAALREKQLAEDRIQKTEKHVCTLWEENTTIRQEIKVIRKEKRVLVKEVKALRAKTTMRGFLQDRPVDELYDAESTPGGGILMDREGERLIDELEAHVESSIRLQEEFLAANQVAVVRCDPLTSSSDVLDRSDSAETTKVNNAVNCAGLEGRESCSDSRSSPIQPKVLSLMDDDSSDDDEDGDDDEEDVNDLASDMASSMSSVSGQLRDVSGMQERASLYDIESDVDSVVTERRHPLSSLDENDADAFAQGGEGDDVSKTIFTENGQATSRLECPLADVMETRQSKGNTGKEDGKVYHLTFYSRKIGLQFQKVPPASVGNGLLTEAMTADLGIPTNSETTASELRRIADMTKRAMGNPRDHDNMTCPVATPVDAVLVCGFIGFDDNANHVRPNLGARLVAFDGISVEFGKWTFESIRKAIQARGRPLTLSFRNDFLTTQQRAILTKAVSEVGAAVPPPKRAVQYRIANPPKQSSSTSQQDLSRGSSYDTEQFGTYSPENARSRDEESVSTRSSSNNRPQTFSAVSSIATSTHDFRSFSETGASSVISSTLGPLMGKILNGVSKTDASGRPSYMSSGGESLEDMPSHRDFQNSLL